MMVWFCAVIEPKKLPHIKLNTLCSLYKSWSFSSALVALACQRRHRHRYDRLEETSSHTNTIVVVLILRVFIYLMCLERIVSMKNKIECGRSDLITICSTLTANSWLEASEEETSLLNSLKNFLCWQKNKHLPSCSAVLQRKFHFFFEYQIAGIIKENTTLYGIKKGNVALPCSPYL